MEDIKSNLDKAIDKCNESVTHSAPKRLSFDYLSHYFNTPETSSKKRRFYETKEESNETHDYSFKSIELSSPWTMRRMKADLIESNTKVSLLSQQLVRAQKAHEEKEILSECKISELLKQCEFSSHKVIDLEKHMTALRKREYSSKQEAIRCQKELSQQKIKFEDDIRELKKLKTENEENLRLIQSNLTDEISEYRRHSQTLELDLKFSQEELNQLKERVKELQKKSDSYDELKVIHEKDNLELECASSQIKSLQSEIANYNDWSEITKNSQPRLASIPSMEKELDRLRDNNKNLHNLLSGKLLLEEQVHNLEVQVRLEEGARSELAELQVKFLSIEKELNEWMKLAKDHCLPTALMTPTALRSRIEDLLQKDIIHVSEKNSNNTKILESELADYKHKTTIYEKNVDALNTALKRQKMFLERVQKKLLVVSKERDCYKQLLENFENDLTISNTNVGEINNIEAQLRSRIEMLEKTLNGYKDMYNSVEKEMANTKQMANYDQSFEVMQNDNYIRMKKELDSLRLENERLRRRKEEIELELEHRCLKGDFNQSKYKILHFLNNPAAEAYENSNNLIEKFQAEIERLKRRIKLLEEDNESTQTRLNETTNMTMNMKEFNQIRLQLESANAKLQKMKECYKSASLEFREVCYMLFGYKVDRVGLNSNYKISSMYAESPDDYLNFRLSEENRLDMLETTYSVTLQPLIETQLKGNESLPAFLSSLTLDLFQRSTVTMS